MALVHGMNLSSNQNKKSKKNNNLLVQFENAKQIIHESEKPSKHKNNESEKPSKHKINNISLNTINPLIDTCQNSHKEGNKSNDISKHLPKKQVIRNKGTKPSTCIIKDEGLESFQDREENLDNAMRDIIELNYPDEIERNMRLTELEDELKGINNPRDLFFKVEENIGHNNVQQSTNQKTMITSNNQLSKSCINQTKQPNKDASVNQQQTDNYTHFYV